MNIKKSIMAALLCITHVAYSTKLNLTVNNDLSEITCIAISENPIVTLTSNQEDTKYTSFTLKHSSKDSKDSAVVLHNESHKENFHVLLMNDDEIQKFKQLVKNIMPSGQTSYTIADVENNTKATELYDFCADIVEKSCTNKHRDINVEVYKISLAANAYKTASNWYLWLKNWFFGRS